MSRVVITMPAYRAEQTLARTVADIPPGIADELILVDDASPDNTVKLARELGGIKVFVHDTNRGYGGNQKTCYTQALKEGADIVVLLHPDYQYEPKAVPLLIAPIVAGDADMTFGSRFAGLGDPRGGGMPRYRFIGNRLTTFLQNLFLGSRFTEMHSGMRAYTRRCLLSMPFLGYSDDFAFDSQFLVDAVTSGQRVVEVPIPTRYTKESSSISVIKSLRYVASGIAYTIKRSRQRGRRGRRWPVTLVPAPEGALPVARTHKAVHDNDVEAMEGVLGGFVLPGDRIARWAGATGSNSNDGLVITEHLEGLSTEAWDEARAAVNPEGLIVFKTELDGPGAVSVLQRAGLRAVDWQQRRGHAFVAARVL
jgi:hypothetical protein